MKPPMHLALLAVAILSAPTPAHSSPAASDAMALAVAEAPLPQVAAPAAPVRPERKSPMLNDRELDTQRGGQSIVVTNQTMTAITSGNILNGDYSAGSVALSDFALSNFNGVGNLLINTGAQVSAQSGMNLTINLGN